MVNNMYVVLMAVPQKSVKKRGLSTITLIIVVLSYISLFTTFIYLLDTNNDVHI